MPHTPGQVHAIAGVREASMGLAHPTRWDLVSDRQAMQEEQALQVGAPLAGQLAAACLGMARLPAEGPARACFSFFANYFLTTENDNSAAVRCAWSWLGSGEAGPPCSSGWGR